MFGPKPRPAVKHSTRHSRVRRHRRRESGWAARLLGCHVLGVPTKVPPSRSSAGFCGMASPGDPKVEHDDAIDFATAQKKVGWFIAVHDSALVRATQRLCHAAHQDQRFSKLQGRLTEAVSQIVPFHPFHGQVGRGFFCDPMIDVAHDGGMSKLRQDASLARKAIDIGLI